MENLTHIPETSIISPSTIGLNELKDLLSESWFFQNIRNGIVETWFPVQLLAEIVNNHGGLIEQPLLDKIELIRIYYGMGVHFGGDVPIWISKQLNTLNLREFKHDPESEYFVFPWSLLELEYCELSSKKSKLLNNQP